MVDKLSWTVWWYDFNGRCIKTMNIFSHFSFNEDVKKLLKKEKDESKFKEELQNKLKYYFWGRCEWEVTISAWPPNEQVEDKKVDVYEQIMLNYDIFADYIWRNK